MSFSADTRRPAGSRRRPDAASSATGSSIAWSSTSRASRDGPSITTGTPAELRAALGGPPPAQRRRPARRRCETLADVALDPHAARRPPAQLRPRPGPVVASPACSATGWAPASTPSPPRGAAARAPATVELVALDWLRTLLGMPEGTEGVMLSGGSLANLTALAAARANDGPGVCYLSDQTHASIVRGLPALGFRAGPGARPALGRASCGCRWTRSAAADRRGPRGRPAPGLRRRQRRHHQHRRRRPAPRDRRAVPRRGALAATSTAPTARRRRSATPAGAPCAASSSPTRSSLDPHKWLFQPYDLGCLLVRRPGRPRAGLPHEPRTTSPT